MEDMSPPHLSLVVPSNALQRDLTILFALSLWAHGVGEERGEYGCSRSGRVCSLVEKRELNAEMHCFVLPRNGHLGRENYNVQLTSV